MIPIEDLPQIDIESEVLRPSISGKQFGAYKQWSVDQMILYTDKSLNIENYPNAEAYLARFKNKNTCKEVEQGKHPWWRLHRPRDPAIFNSPKFIGLTTSKKIELVYDEDQTICVTDAMYVFRTRKILDWKFVMAILQSATFLFLYRTANQNESRVIPQIKATKLYSLPFPNFEAIPDLVASLAQTVDEIYAADEATAGANTVHEENLLSRRKEALLARLERDVQKAYGLSEFEARAIQEKLDK